MSYKIAVSGASEISHCAKNIVNLAEEVGREIVRQKCVLITGATTGAPYFTARAVKKSGGISIGFSPAASELAHRKTYRLPSDYFDVMIYTGFDYSGRNLLMTRACDGLIVICGRMGTLNEFTIAFEDRKPIGILTGSGGTADFIKTIIQKPHRRGEKIIYSSDPGELVRRLIEAINQKRSNLI